VLRPVSNPVSPTGGLVVLKGNLGRAVMKVSAVKPENRVIEAEAIVFHSQQDLMDKFRAGELERDFIAVIPYQGPKANGMPELHGLTPPLAVLQERGYKVALVTDGRMSGASGKIPAAIHLTPEALSGGLIGKVRDGDMMRLDAETGDLTISVDADELAAREAKPVDLNDSHWSSGRELFGGMRTLVTGAEEGAMSFQLREVSYDN
jgi:phosphogluconate dehydratase